MEACKEKFVAHVKFLQEEFLKGLSEQDPEGRIQRDCWERKDFEGNPGGGGDTRVFQGPVIEKAGVNVSEVHGEIDPKFAKVLGSDQTTLWASGISIIVHPFHPRVPSFHANFRMIELGDQFWFGGGADLTPYYPYLEDFEFFHSHWKAHCDPFDVYQAMKKACDEYFVNAHRESEMRGIGGVFFDRFRSGDPDRDLRMTMELASAFPGSYLPLVKRRKTEPYDQEDQDFQLMRRGRYAEFNLLHDRGTAFGLKTGGRIESILVSMPPRCTFPYQYQPRAGSPQEEMLKYYWPRDWVL